MSPRSIQFKLIGHLITVPAYVNGMGPYDFWIDTGGPGLTILRFFADELGLKVIDTGRRGIGAGGEVPIHITTIDTFEFAGIRFKKVQATVLNITTDEKFKHRFYGCIGYGLLKDYRVCIDYVNKRITLIKPRRTLIK
ncbi:MAG: retropepsin-like aspartic protease [Candidatus Methanomethylicia archaeon]